MRRLGAALLDSLNIFRRRGSRMERVCRTARIRPRGPVDAPKRRLSLHWMRQQVRLHGGRDQLPLSARVAPRDDRAERWWLRVKGHMLESDSDVVPVR